MVIHVDWLAEDLLLLTIDAYRGRLGQAYALSYALMGAELIRLAAQGQIDLSGDRIVLTNAALTGDAELDAALAGIGESASPPRPDEWVARPRPRISGRYLERLEAVGVVRAETRFSATRWRISEASRLAEARQRLDVIAGSAGAVDLAQTAYAGLACAIGLDRRLYRGRARRAERDRLREIAAGRWTASPAAASDSADPARADSSAATLAAIDAATRAAVSAAAQAVAQATAAAANPGYGG
jgi:hypothetical protein